MHEYAVTQGILKIALQHAEKAGAQRITDINLVIGQLASVVDDSVQFYWDILARETIAQGAMLHFRRIPAEMTCGDCGNAFHPGDESFECPGCASAMVSVTKGSEFQVESIDVE